MRIFFLIILGFLPMLSLADNAFHPNGATLGFGSSTSLTSAITVGSNPAAPSTLAGSRERSYRFGILSQIGYTMEIGSVDNFIDDLDKLVDQLDKELTASEAIALADEFNSILPSIGNDGYINTGGAIHFPGFPFLIATPDIKGKLYADLHISSQFHGRFLDRPVTVNPQTDGVETNSAIYTKASVYQQFGLGYSRIAHQDRAGKLHIGVKARFLRIGLNKTLISIQEISEDQTSVSNYYSNDFFTGLEYQSAFDFDVGLLWQAPLYQFGVSFVNLLAPTVTYPEIGGSCDEETDQVDQDRCYVARSFANEVDLNESYTQDRQLKFEAARYSRDKSSGVHISVDATAVNDAAGELRKWATLNGHTSLYSWWNMRAGVRKNLAGNGLSMITVGSTFLNSLNIDVGYGLSSITIEGNQLPRWLTFNIGLEVRY